MSDCQLRRDPGDRYSRLGTRLTLNPLGLLLHRCCRVADGEALVQILPHEYLDGSESLILHRVCKLVNNQPPLPPVVVAKKIP